MTKMYRQGDVLLIKTDKIPHGSSISKKKSNIVVEGEATGHAHRLINGLIYEKPKSMFDDSNEPTMWIHAQKNTRLVHEEHGPIEIEVGFYIVIRQREYDGEESRLVRD